MSDAGPRSAPRRPRQVTFAGIVAAVACGLLLVNLFDALSRVSSADVRDGIAEQLARQNDFGLSVADVVGLLRIVVFVSAALAAAGLVLALYTLQRHRASRVGLTVVAVLMLFTATFVTGLLPVLIAFAVGRLWGRDARDWFAGRQPRTAAGPPPVEAPPDGPPAMEAWPPTRPPAPGSDPPPSPYSFGTPPPQQAWPQPRTPKQPPRTGDGRPTQVAVAAWLTWVACSLSALMCLLLAITLTADAGPLVARLQRNQRINEAGLSAQDIISTLWVLAAVGFAWSLTAIALAVLAYRRVGAGRIGLLVSAVLAAVVGLVAVPVGWLNAAAAVATVVLLLRRDARRWFGHRGPPGSSPGREAPGP